MKKLTITIVVCSMLLAYASCKPMNPREKRLAAAATCTLAAVEEESINNSIGALVCCTAAVFLCASVIFCAKNQTRSLRKTRGPHGNLVKLEMARRGSSQKKKQTNSLHNHAKHTAIISVFRKRLNFNVFKINF